MRTCIKCERELPDGQFDDNWRHKVHVCYECRRLQTIEYRKSYRASQLARARRLRKRIVSLEKQLEMAREDLVRVECELRHDRKQCAE